MSSTEKKPRLVTVNPIITDHPTIERFQNAYTNRKSLREDGEFRIEMKTNSNDFSFDLVIQLDHEPFSHCVIDDFLIDRQNDRFCSQLINELKNIKTNEKNNDLYKFHQVFFFLLIRKTQENFSSSFLDR